MEIGDKFTFNSNGKVRTALFLEEKGDFVVAVLYEDVRFQGLMMDIPKYQIENEHKKIKNNENETN